LTIPLEALLRAAAATLNLYPDASAAAVAATAAATEQLDEEGRRALCWRRSDGASVVHCAALGGHRATMETALRSCAATRAHDRAGRGALAWQMNDGASPLHVAAFVSSAPCVASLLKAGADPLALAAPVGRHGARMTPLDVASSAAPAAAASASALERGRAADVAALLQKGVDSAKYLATLEMWACRKLGDFAAEKQIGILGLAARVAAAKVDAARSSSAGAAAPATAQSEPASDDGLAVVLAQASALAAKVASKYAAAVATGRAIELDAAKSDEEVRFRIVHKFENAMDAVKSQQREAADAVRALTLEEMEGGGARVEELGGAQAAGSGASGGTPRSNASRRHAKKKGKKGKKKGKKR
jgi:hypothetical protein